MEACAPQKMLSQQAMMSENSTLPRHDHVGPQANLIRNKTSEGRFSCSSHNDISHSGGDISRQMQIRNAQWQANSTNKRLRTREQTM
ncbi:hypothetical protein MUK42_37508 [Musa troglodytarum]|uniref:Uncharacterized protein n=1 Tax=Musa troglodytarum TaxID=320322 RepID=A0A9E7JXR6_9LILI|nr:hypothetical protein MUK42_37508 [Musa troglodytarum]